MKKTLADETSRQRIVERVRALSPDSVRRWGTMSPHEMVCHLTDSYAAVIGERAITPMRMWIPQPVVKWLMLHAPWPKGAPTRPEVDAHAAGTRPLEFDSDRQRLLDVIARFCSASDEVRTQHPVAGTLNRADWLRWGYLHADHHLRQFHA